MHAELIEEPIRPGRQVRGERRCGMGDPRQQVDGHLRFGSRWVVRVEQTDEVVAEKRPDLTAHPVLPRGDDQVVPERDAVEAGGPGDGVKWTPTSGAVAASMARNG